MRETDPWLASVRVAASMNEEADARVVQVEDKECGHSSADCLVVSRSMDE